MVKGKRESERQNENEQESDSDHAKQNSQNGLKGFTAYTKALMLFELVVTDLESITGKYELTRLISQQIASADSIASNIEEGYGRGSKKDYSHFLIIARGSAQETMGRYGRLAHWINPETVKERVALCSKIIAILTASIRKLRSGL